MIDVQNETQSLDGTPPAQLLNTWRRRARVAQIGHYKSAVKLEARYRWSGVVVVALNALVGTTVFASLSQDFDAVWIKIAAGGVSVLTAVLAGIQSFDRAGERAETHRKAATQFSALQREVELYVATRDARSAERDREFLQGFNDRYVQLVNESPTADEQLHLAAKETVRREEANGSRNPKSA